MKDEPVSRKVFTAPDTLWAEIAALQVAETARLQKAVSQAEIVRQALVIGIKAMAQKGNLDAT